MDDDERAKIASDAKADERLENRIGSLESKVSDLWMIGGPIVTLIRSWKGLAALAALIFWINKPGIAAAIQHLFGDGQ